MALHPKPRLAFILLHLVVSLHYNTPQILKYKVQNSYTIVSNEIGLDISRINPPVIFV